MGAVLIIAGLTIREAIRRRLFVISLLVAGVFFFLSLLPYFMGVSHQIGILHPHGGRPNIGLEIPVMLVLFMGLPMMRFFAVIQSTLLATGSLAGELDRGDLLVVLPRPVRRSQVLFGKWVGVILMVTLNVGIWAILLWSSLYIQLGTSYSGILEAAGIILLYPVMFCTLAMFFSTFCSASLASALTLFCGGVAWAEGILVTIGRLPFVDLPLMVKVGHACPWVVPISHVDRWTDRALGDLSPSALTMRMAAPPDRLASPSDLLYIALWLAVILSVTLILFKRRDL